MDLSYFTEKLPYIHTSIYSILLAIFWFAVGYIIVSIVMDLFKRSLKRTHLPRVSITFLVKFIKALLLVIVLLAVLPIIGIDVTSATLGLSAIVGLILGFGLQDTMANLFSGLWLAILKPFEVGDYIQVNGVEGQLKSLGIMSTTLTTFDNKFILIPNKLIWGATITNYSKMDRRRIDLTVGVAYGTKLDKAISVAMKVMKNHKKISNDPKPDVVITDLGDSAINLQLRAWVNTNDYWDVKSDLARKVVEEFAKNKIEIPYPQLDVHLKKK